jgi:hypothetical protein
MKDRITDQPPGAEPWGGMPPWEQPGAFRLDCDPHRGDLLRTLAWADQTLGLFSLVPILGIVPGPGALTLALTVWLIATRDLRRMQRGVMDPEGRDMTRDARVTAGWAVYWALGGAAIPLL